MTITTDPPAADTLAAARYRDASAVLDAASAARYLPFPLIPSTGPVVARFCLTATVGSEDAPRILDDALSYLSGALDVEFRPRPGHPAGPNWLVLSATMSSGLTVEIQAWARRVRPADETAADYAAGRLEVIRQVGRDTYARIMTGDAA